MYDRTSPCPLHLHILGGALRPRARRSTSHPVIFCISIRHGRPDPKPTTQRHADPGRTGIAPARSWSTSATVHKSVHCRISVTRTVVLEPLLHHTVKHRPRYVTPANPSSYACPSVHVYIPLYMCTVRRCPPSTPPCDHALPAVRRRRDRHRPPQARTVAHPFRIRCHRCRRNSPVSDICGNTPSVFSPL